MSASKTTAPLSTEVPMGPFQAPAFAPETITFSGRTKQNTDNKECFWEDVTLSFTPLSSSSASSPLSVNGFCTLITDSAPVPCVIMGDYHSSLGIGSFALMPLHADADFTAAKSPCAAPAPEVERFEFALRVASASSKRVGSIKMLFFSDDRRGVLRSAAGATLSTVTPRA